MTNKTSQEMIRRAFHATLIDRSAFVPARDKWYVVSEHLPNDGANVLAIVLCRNGDFMAEVEFVDCGETFEFLMGGELVAVSHWVPLNKLDE